MLALSALGLSPQALAAERLKLGSKTPFSFDALVQQARELAGKPFAPPPTPQHAILEKLDYAALGKIHYKTEDALFAKGPGQFPVTFFHLGKFSQVPVQMYVIEGEGQRARAREIIYEPSYFDIPKDSPARHLEEGVGFAGFRFQESRLGDQKKLDWRKNDWVAFQGASYFRAIGQLYQYGLSARGIAVNTAVAGVPEEFPNFTRFYFETPRNDSDTVVVYALLDGPSVSGAYRFAMTRNKEVLMDIDSALFLRKDIKRFGVAPLTSMYWFSETRKPMAIDWRPEVHDSDGLAMWNGDGEHIWRPLNDPDQIAASAFTDHNPHGFGLLQRDRNFDHYLDGVYYGRRPSLWMQPKDSWGEGSVQLIEIPTDDEINDNIVAMWVPKQPARAGDQYRLRYKLYWAADEPFPTNLARCVATRLGRGGQPGELRPKGVRKFVVAFHGGPLTTLPYGVKPQAVLSTSRGTFSYVFTEPVPDGVDGHWRAHFDLTVDGKAPVDMRLYLKAGDKTLSETWLYQYNPFDS